MKNKINSRFTNCLLLCSMLLVVAPRVTAQIGWTSATPMTSPRFGMATGVIDGKIYFAGGTGDGTNMLGTLEVFDPATNTWSALASMPAARYTAFAGVIGGKLYVAGGHNGSSTVATLFVYDPPTNTWSTLAPMPTARAILTGGVINGKLYVAGGYTSTTTFASVNKLEVYDPATDTWTTKKPMPNSGRYGAAAAVFSNRLYVAGGYGNDVGYTKILEVYNALTDSWTAKASMPEVQYLHAAGVLGGQLYTSGGYESAANPTLNRTQVYDPTTDVWSVAPALPTARRLPSAEVVGNSLYVVGGSNGTSLTTHEVLTPPQGSSAPEVWLVEKIAHINPLPNCGPSVEISGLVHDSMNRPAVSWGVFNRCTFPGVDQFWARKDAGAWGQYTIANYNGPNRRGFRGVPSLVMRADDNPFLVYADVGINDGVSCDGPLCPGITTHLANLADNPVGPGGIVETVGSGRSSCTTGPRFAAQFTPSSLTPNWVTGLACSGNDSLRLNGVPVTDKSNIGMDYAVGPAGQNHIIFSDTDVYYNRGVAGSDLKIATINRFSGDVQIAADGDNKLHAIIRGYDSHADFDPGLMSYVTSTDGVNWANPVFIDTTRTATRPAIALDNNGNPAVAYWRFGELRFAYLRNGAWSNVHVITVPNAPYPEQKRLQLEFDKNNVPTIAFFDPCSNNIFLAKPSTETQLPVDLTLDISSSPDPLPAGLPLTYTIKVINNGTREATHVVVTETLPANVTLISASPAPVSQLGNTLYFDMGVVTPASNCDVITIKVMPDGVGTVTNVVSVTGDDVDSNGDNNTVTANAEVRPAECFPPRNGMVAWWMAEGDANDTQNQNGFPGTMKGAVTFAPGKVGQAFNLNGTDAYIEVDDNASFNPNGSFSINAWVNTTTGGYIATRYECGGSCPAGANSLYFLYVGGSSGKIGFFIRDTAGNVQEIASSKVVADGTFHHIVGVRDSDAGTMTIYVDGVADASASLIATAPIRNDDGFYDPLIIGAVTQGGSSAIQGHFKGLIDDVAYYNRALSAAEVQAIYTAPLCSANQEPNMTNPGDRTNAEGDSVSLQLSASDPDNDVLTYSTTGLPPGLSVNPTTGLITGLLDYDAAGTYRVTTSISDSTTSASADFDWLVTNTNRNPVASDGLAQTKEDTAVQIPLTASDADGDSLAFSIVANPSRGTVSVASNFATYTPAPDFSGTDSFTFKVNDGEADSNAATVSVTVTPVNDSPHATDDAATTEEDTEILINVLSNDLDIDGDALVVSSVTQGAHGAVAASAVGITYTPQLNYNGTDSFSYSVSDGHGGTSTAIVNITVRSINDPPSVAGPPDQTSNEGTSISLQISADDADSNALSYAAAGLPPGLTINPVSGLVTGGLDFDTAGTYRIELTVSDGNGGSGSARFNWTVVNVNRAPSAFDFGVMLDEDTSQVLTLQATDPDGDALDFTVTSDPSHGALSGTGGTLIYTPEANYNGPDSFTYIASDGSIVSNTATVSLLVKPVDDSPVLATVGNQVISEGALVTFTLNGSDPDGDTLRYSAANLPAGASLDATTGAFSWRPNYDQSGVYTVNFVVTDPIDLSGSETITINVADVELNEGPVCSLAYPSVTIIWPPDHKQTIPFSIFGVTDPDNDHISVRITSILQDEPTNTLGDGSTWIDGGGIATSEPWVRAERVGTPKLAGNGRIYEIFFEASDGRGKICTGSVKVGVPHDQGQRSVPVDDGKRYDSTVAGGPCLNCNY